MGDLRKSLMQSRWADVHLAAVPQQLQEIEDAIEQCFADDTSEVWTPPLAISSYVHDILAGTHISVCTLSPADITCTSNKRQATVLSFMSSSKVLEHKNIWNQSHVTAYSHVQLHRQKHCGAKFQTCKPRHAETVLLQMRSLQDVVEKNCQELKDLLPLVSSLAGSKKAKEQLWIEVFRFMDQVMPSDTADCSLYLLAEDAFNAITYADQVCCYLQPCML